MKWQTFVCFWSSVGEKKIYKEIMTAETDSPRKYAESVLVLFNATLRPHEQPRVLRSVMHLPFNGKAQHDWEKVNLVTIVKGIHNYDKMKCRNCPATGKRHGLSENVTRDAKFSLAVYCSLSKKGSVS